MADRNTRLYKWKSKAGTLYTLYADGGVIIIRQENNVPEGQPNQHQWTLSEARDVYRSLGDIAAGQSDDCTGQSGQEYIWEKDEYRHNHTLLEVLRQVYKDAKAQGDPTDPEVQRSWRRDRPKVSMAVPNTDNIQKSTGPGGAVIFNI